VTCGQQAQGDGGLGVHASCGARISPECTLIDRPAHTQHHAAGWQQTVAAHNTITNLVEWLYKIPDISMVVGLPVACLHAARQPAATAANSLPACRAALFGGFGGTGTFFAIALLAEAAGIVLYAWSGEAKGQVR
jgi:hypothetical protein